MENKTEFSELEILNWKAFERVRAGGRFNMFDPKARQASGLGPDEYAFCMDHYSELKEAAGK